MHGGVEWSAGALFTGGFGEMAKLVVCGTFMLEMPEKAGGEAGGPYWGWGEAVKWR